ncbi:MAG: hypothetical protein ACJA0J_000956, partial [Bdellovibrionota bacterium]
RLLTAGFVKSLANTTALSTFFASPAVKIHQIKKHVLFNSRPLVALHLFTLVNEHSEVSRNSGSHYLRCCSFVVNYSIIC